MGWLAATLAGATFGAVSAISESLTNHGVDHDTAARSAQAVQAGGTLVAVRCDSDRLSTIESIIMGTSDTAYDTDTVASASNSRVA